IEKAEAEAEAAALPSAASAIAGSANEATSEAATSSEAALLTLAEISPRAAVVEAWLLVEHELRKLAELHGVRSTMPRQATRELAAQGAIPRGLTGLIANLSDLRNEAVHNSDAAIATDDAVRYVELATRIAASLRELR